jgi:tripartite-type tricarboxylate transporter receptor subunit TctC
VPTMAEAGISDLESDTLTGIVAPIGTSPDIVNRWNAEIVKMVADPAIKKRLGELGFEPVANKPAEFGARIKTEIAKWDKVVRDAHIRAQ